MRMTTLPFRPLTDVGDPLSYARDPPTYVGDADFSRMTMSSATRLILLPQGQVVVRMTLHLNHQFRIGLPFKCPPTGIAL